MQTRMEKLDRLLVQGSESGLFGQAGYALLNTDDQTNRFLYGGDSEAVFDLSSVTKALVTTPLVHREMYRRGLDFHCATVEDFAGHGPFSDRFRDFNVANLLNHESGLPAWQNYYVSCLEGASADDIPTENRRSPVSAPATLPEASQSHQNKYSDVGMIVLGKILEEIYLRPLREVFWDFCRHDLGFVGGYAGCLDRQDPSGVTETPLVFASTGYCYVRQRILCGEVHDENAWALGGFSGHSGLFGSARAVARFVDCLLASRIGRQMMINCYHHALANPVSDSALGWRTGRDVSSKVFGAGHAIGHLGFTGTAFWFDPRAKIGAVLLTNRVGFGRLRGLAEIRDFRRRFFTLAYEELSGK